MPFYEYQCDACNERLEILQKISDAPRRTCPQCGGETLRKQISRAAFRLKGTGWYETDFKNSAPPAVKTDAKPAAADKPAPAADAGAQAAPAKTAKPAAQ